MLYYARSENTEKDYFVKRLSLDEIVHQVLLKFRYVLLEEKVILDIHDTENVIYTDEKWLSFILSQILQNAVKYMDKPQKKLTVYSADNRENIALIIEDNGCGIRRSELARVFEKGFTGSNRKKANATGMGLYLAKKLCDRLGLQLQVASEEEKYHAGNDFLSERCGAFVYRLNYFRGRYNCIKKCKSKNWKRKNEIFLAKIR